jgi:methionyl aminopeptidase
LIGDVDQKGRDLVHDNEECLKLAIDIVKPGVKFSKIGEIINEHATKRGYSIDRNFCGHGIGRRFHQAPLVYHFLNQEEYMFKSGMVFTIEPIFVQGDNGFLKWPDQWTVVSKDGSRSSQCEHTILVTDNGHEVLTK